MRIPLASKYKRSPTKSYFIVERTMYNPTMRLFLGGLHSLLQRGFSPIGSFVISIVTDEPEARVMREYNSGPRALAEYRVAYKGSQGRERCVTPKESINYSSN